MMSDIEGSETPGWESYFRHVGKQIENAPSPYEAMKQALLCAHYLLRVNIDEPTAARGRDIINMALLTRDNVVPAVMDFPVDVIATTTKDGNVPGWAMEYVQMWRSLLHLDAWAIRLKTDPCPNYEPTTLACVEIMPNIMTAHITIRDSIPASLDGHAPDVVRYWQTAIIHELVHVLVGRVTDFIEKDIWPELAPAGQRIAQATLTREVEPVVELLANILYTLQQAGHEPA